MIGRREGQGEWEGGGAVGGGKYTLSKGLSHSIQGSLAYWKVLITNLHPKIWCPRISKDWISKAWPSKA